MIILFFLLYLVLAWASLWQWGSPEPGSRIDLFSGGFFAATPLWLGEYAVFLKSIGPTREVRQEAIGATYDPAMTKWVTALSLAEMAIFIDYSHWRLVPALENTPFQSVGLALWFLIPGWLLWADLHLGRHFSDENWPSRLVTGGPFRYVRHPRYAGLLASRIAFYLLFASAVGWLFGVGWLLLVAKRIRLEEAHLRQHYGADYDVYASKTPRLLPGIY